MAFKVFFLTQSLTQAEKSAKSISCTIHRISLYTRVHYAQEIQYLKRFLAI